MTKLPARRPFPGTPELWKGNVDHFAGIVQRDTAKAPWTPPIAANIIDHALANAARRTLLDARDPQIKAELTAVACAAAALFEAAATTAGTEVTVPHPSGGTVTITSTGLDPENADPIQWRRGLLAALVTRHAGAIGLLGKTPVETLRALAPNLPVWMMKERPALQAIALRSPGAGAPVVEAAEAADPDKVADQKDWVLDIVTPELQLGFAALSHDQAHFDDWIVKAIKCHHHYYGRAEEKKNVHGQLALAPLAMACVAHDLGLQVPVESDYLPRWLITG